MKPQVVTKRETHKIKGPRRATPGIDLELYRDYRVLGFATLLLLIPLIIIPFNVHAAAVLITVCNFITVGTMASRLIEKGAK